MPFFSRTQRQTDYHLFAPSCPIVIDNGASYLRIGWAGEVEPRVIFRNIVQRPRHKVTGETVTIVGDHDPASLRFFDCTRSGPRSAFDINVVYQFEIMECILDFAFDRLGASGTQIDHPILITECVCNPVYSRYKMAELLFETYGVPAIAFGVDVAFSYKYNQHLGICGKDGLAVCPGFSTTHSIPFVDGEPVYKASCRTNIGGYHITDYLKQLLSLKASLTWEKAEDLKKEHCYISFDYAADARLFQLGAKEAEERTRCWQLPWIPPVVEEPPSEEELSRKVAIKERQGQRLRDMAEAKRTSRINELENELQGLEFLLQQLSAVSEDDIPSFLSSTGYVSQKQVEAAISKVSQSLRKTKGEQIDVGTKPEVSAAEKYPLLNRPDNMLTPDEIKEKKRQLFLKTTSEGRQRAKQRRFEDKTERERQNQQEEERRLENPERYMEQLHAKHKELSERVEQRKRLRTYGNQSNEIIGFHGSVGRGERLSAAQKERMRLLTTAAFDRGKGEDTFGARDEDWQLYKLMSKDNEDDDEEPDPEEAELSHISARLQEIDATFAPKSEVRNAQPVVEVAKVCPLTEEDFQILIGVERFRCPEILFNPNRIGVHQVGLDEMASVSIQRLQSESQAIQDKITSSILVTGGSSLFPGITERLEAGVRMERPCRSTIKVVRASDPVLDAWRGAAVYAASPQFAAQTIHKNYFYEKGPDLWHSYHFRYQQ